MTISPRTFLGMSFAMAVFVLVAGPITAQDEDAHPFSIHDMLAMQRIGEPTVSPDGESIAFSLRTTDFEKNGGATDIWITGIDGQDLRQLTIDPASDFNPLWTPDSDAILFLSTRSGSSQVWKVGTEAGASPTQITDLPLDLSNLILSRDAEKIAFSLEVFPDANSPEATKARLDAIEADPATGMIYDSVFVRHWDTWKDGRRNHVFVLPSSGEGEPVDVMGSMDADCPSKPFGGSEDMTFTPDGTGVVIAARDVGREEAWSTDFDLYLCTTDGSAAPVCLTESNEAWDCCPSFSPDGNTLAYLAMSEPGYESDRNRIVLLDLLSGETRVLTEDWDRSAGAIVWTEDGKTIFTGAGNLGQKSLFAIDVTTGDARVVVRNGSCGSPMPVGDELIYSMHSLMGPTELYAVQTDGTSMRRITTINDERLALTKRGDTEQLTFTGAEGDEVYAYIVYPTDFDPEKKYPIAFLIHGGPQGSFGNMFHYRWNPQVYAAAGYACVMVDFHGSTGYGQAFTDSIQGDWGGKPFVDLQLGLAAALEEYPWMDGDRVGALGASFGGYMINWIAGNWPERFRCLINHDGNLDERMAYYNTEELWFPERDHMGKPWTDPENFEKHNPVNYVQNWQTPMLVIHGAQDYRVVDTQGLGTFNALQRQGIPSRLLYFPDENHWVLKPHNSILWHDTVIDWLDQWVKE
jgi:dipeptidyl aminopeptidase/acylaminoacyl peptidase